MSVTEIDVGRDGRDMREKLQDIFGDSQDLIYMAWKIDENGYHVMQLQSERAPDGWARTPLILGPVAMSAWILKWLEELAFTSANTPALFGYEPVPDSNPECHRMVFDHKCLGAVRIVPA